MQKILALSALVVSLAVGCASKTDELCIEVKECAGEDDPAAKCDEEEADLSDDAQACADACKDENEALAACQIEFGECKDKVFAAEAADCEDESKDAADCAKDC